MPESSSPTLDQVSLQMLLFLSNEQALSIAEIAQALDQTPDSIYDRAVLLERHHLVEEKDGKLRISLEGMAYMRERGVRRPKTVQASQVKEPETYRGVLFFPILFFLILLSGLALLITFAIQTPNAWLIVGAVATFILAIFYAAKSFHKVAEYERIVIFRTGKCIGEKGPGLIPLIPFIDRLTRVDLRVRHQAMPHETCITKDTVQTGVDFVFYWKVQQPVWAITRVTDAEESIRLLAAALLRAVIADFSFSDVLNKREKINTLLKDKINLVSLEWGVSVTDMEIREVKPPEEIVKSMHKQRQAEWRGQATVINAEAQAEALRQLYRLAAQIGDKTQNLRYLETLRNFGKGEATKYVFPPELIDLIRSLLHSSEGEESSSDTDADTPSDQKS